MQLLLGFLGKQIIGEPQGEQPLCVQGRNHAVVVRVILESSACINDAGEAEAVEFAHKETRRGHLLLGRKLRPFGQRGIEEQGVGFGDEQPRGIALSVPLDCAAWGIRRVFGVAHGPQCGAVQQGTVIEVEDEDWRVGCDSIDLVERRQAALGELEFRPAAYHAHPLRGRGPLRLLAQQAQRICQRGHAIPAQFQRIVEPAANRMHV